MVIFTPRYLHPFAEIINNNWIRFSYDIENYQGRSLCYLIINCFIIYSKTRMKAKSFCLRFKKYGIFARFLANNEPRRGLVTTASNTTSFGPNFGQRTVLLHADGVSSWNNATASRYRELYDAFWRITNENRLWIYNNLYYLIILMVYLCGIHLWRNLMWF